MSILFLLSDFERGGIPRVTLNLTRLLKESGERVGVIYGNPRGMFSQQFKDSGCNLISGGIFLRAIMCNLQKEPMCFRLFAFCVKILRKLMKCVTRVDLFQVCAKRLGHRVSLLGYDAIMATSEGIPLQWLMYVKSGRKLVWIHNDYAHEPPENPDYLRSNLKNVDGVLCVAEHVKNAFLSYFPDMETKAIALHNAVNGKEIIRLAKIADDLDARFKPSPFSILSIGRFNERPKHFSAIPEIAAELNRQGCMFHWYIIGSGSPAETDILEAAIHQHHVEKSVILLGEKTNPYPYLMQCSFFALTSRYEAYPSVLNEALALGTPIITTDFEGVRELVNEAKAIICPIETFAECIKDSIKGQAQSRQREDFTEHNRKIVESFKRFALG